VDFATSEHSLQKLKTATYAGMIFVSFRDDAEPLADYLGADMRSWLDRTLKSPAQSARLLRQVINGNWKLYAENVRDPYQRQLVASLQRDLRHRAHLSGRRVTLDGAHRHTLSTRASARTRPSELLSPPRKSPLTKLATRSPMRTC